MRKIRIPEHFNRVTINSSLNNTDTLNAYRDIMAKQMEIKVMIMKISL